MPVSPTLSLWKPLMAFASPLVANACKSASVFGGYCAAGVGVGEGVAVGAFVGVAVATWAAVVDEGVELAACGDLLESAVDTLHTTQARTRMPPTMARMSQRRLRRRDGCGDGCPNGGGGGCIGIAPILYKRNESNYFIRTIKQR